MARSGVYQVVCGNTGHRYIGSADSIETAWLTHRSELRQGTHPNLALQYAWGVFGEESFSLEVLKEAPLEDLPMLEFRYIEELKPEFNVQKAASRPTKEKKSVTTIRMGEKTSERVKNYCHAARVTQTELIETALNEFFTNHGFLERYVAKVVDGHVVLMKMSGEESKILSVESLNGDTLRKVAERYSERLRVPVAIEDEKTET